MEQVAGTCSTSLGNFAVYSLTRRRAVIATPMRSEIGQRLQRRLRIAEPAQELGVADRTDVGGAEQADTSESFFLGKSLA